MSINNSRVYIRDFYLFIICSVVRKEFYFLFWCVFVLYKSIEKRLFLSIYIIGSIGFYDFFFW